jgi:GTP pyrophosphokinase
VHRNPSRDWLKFVKTAKARTRIKHWIRTQERERSISLAKEMLEKEGRRMDINFQKALKQGKLEKIASEFSLKSVDDLLSAVGYAKITPKQVLHRLMPKEASAPERQPKAKQKPKEEKESKSEEVKEGVRIKGIDDVLIRFAQCCQPVPGDPIIGYISRGRGVIVHRSDCPNIQHFSPARLVTVTWEGEESALFPATIRIVCDNKKGVLAQITDLLAREGVNIESGHFHSSVEGRTDIYLNLQISDSSHLYRCLEELTELKAVHEAVRTSSKESAH